MIAIPKDSQGQNVQMLGGDLNSLSAFQLLLSLLNVKHG